MSFDRAKTLQSAQKHLARGNLDKAIADYERVVQADPKDARHLLKLGDIYSRKGATKDAGRTYRKVAELYAEEGFFLKAVAVYKQILKFDPESLDTWERLAEMYELLSLTSDALAAYDHIAESFVRAGQTRKAVDAMGRMVDLDPENVAACIKYAEGLSKCNLRDEAADAFRRGAAILEKQGRIEDYIKVAERLLYHSPDDHEFARGLAQRYLDRGDARHALAKLQGCFKSDPRNAETLELLAKAFHALGQTQKGVAVYKELSRVHEERAETDRQVAAMRAVLQLDPNDAEARRVVETLGAAAARSRPPVDAQSGIDVPEDEDDLILVDDELDDDPSGVINLADSGARPLPEQEDDEVIIVDDDDDDDDAFDVTTGEFHVEEPGLPGGPTEDSVTAIVPTPDDGLSLQDGEDGGVDTDDEIFVIEDEEEQEDDAIFVVDEDGEPDSAELFADAADEDDEDDEGPELLIEAADEDDSALFAEAVEVERRSMMPTAAPSAPGPLPTFSTPADAPVPRFEPARAAEIADEDGELPEEIEDAIEEADFYLQQGLADEARDSLSDALESFPGHPALMAKLREIDGDAGDATEADDEDSDDAFAMAAKLADEVPEVQPAAPASRDTGPVEVSDVISQFRDGVAKAVDAGDSATHYDLGIAYMEMGLQAEAIEEFKLCLGDPERLCQSQTMIGLAYVARNEPEPAIAHFQAALEAGPTAEGQLDLWFELGNAYEFLKRNSDALIYYEKVEEVNPDYRDVAARVERLGVQSSADEEDQEFDEMFDNLIIKD